MTVVVIMCMSVVIMRTIMHTLNSICMYVCKTEWDMRTEIFFHASFSTHECQGNVRMVYELSAAVINELKVGITAAVCHVLCTTHLRTPLQHYVQLFAAMSRWQHYLVGLWSKFACTNNIFM